MEMQNHSSDAYTSREHSRRKQYHCDIKLASLGHKKTREIDPEPANVDSDGEPDLLPFEEYKKIEYYSYGSDSETDEEDLRYLIGRQPEDIPQTTQSFRGNLELHTRLLELERSPRHRQGTPYFSNFMDALLLRPYIEPEYLFELEYTWVMPEPLPELVKIIAENLRNARRPDFRAVRCKGTCMTFHQPRDDIDAACKCPGVPPLRYYPMVWPLDGEL